MEKYSTVSSNYNIKICPFWSQNPIGPIEPTFSVGRLEGWHVTYQNKQKIIPMLVLTKEWSV